MMGCEVGRETRKRGLRPEGEESFGKPVTKIVLTETERFSYLGCSAHLLHQQKERERGGG